MSMRKKVVLALSVFGLAIASQSFANNVGVGFGTVILQGKEGKVFEVLAVTLNGVSGSSTFAITMGTMGYKEGEKIGLAAADLYIAENMEALAADISRGDGEYLDTLSHILKVSDSAAFKNAVSANFDMIYTSEDVTSTEVSAAIKRLAS